jgi:hypothetical protein
LLDLKNSPDTESADIAISQLISHLRTVIGVAELTKLRDQAIQMATTRSKEDQP